MPVTSRTALDAQNFAKTIDLLLSVLNIPYKIRIKRAEECFGGDRYVFGIDCGDGFSNVYLSSNLINLYTLNMCSFLYVSHTSIKWCKKRKMEYYQHSRSCFGLDSIAF